MRDGCDPWVRKIPWRRAWQPTPAFLPGESHGQRSLAGHPWGHKGDMTEWACTHTCLEPIKYWNKRSAPNVKGRERKTEGARKGSRKRGEGETRALARTGFTAVPYPLSLLGRISAAPALVSCNQLFSCLSHLKSKGCLWKPILWPCVRLAWSRLLVSIHQLDWMDTHDFMVKTGQPRRMADAVFEWKSRRNGKQEKADVSRR